MLDNAATLADNQVSKEDYLLLRAKEALSTDIYAAKSWLITARSLFPHSAKVQFEAYRIEKLSKNVKEAAKCFGEMITTNAGIRITTNATNKTKLLRYHRIWRRTFLWCLDYEKLYNRIIKDHDEYEFSKRLDRFQNFPEDREIWAEIEAVTACLRSERTDPDSDMLCQMFQHIPQELQHRLLIMTADHSEDTMEHCKLLLLLLKRFPQTVATHGPRLVETLLTAEKHSHPGQTINDFRRLLACDALPLLGSAPVELNPRLALRLLCKAVEFYLAYIQQPQDSQIAQPWERLFEVIESVGKKLGWESSSLFALPWNQETYSERLHQYAASYSSSLSEEVVARQLLVCATIVLLRVLNDHNALISSGDVGYCLVEAIGAPSLSSTEPKLKKRKREEPSGVILTSDGDYNGSGLSLAVSLWDLLHTTDSLQHEFAKMCLQMRLENWIKPFRTDVAVYKGLHVDALNRFGNEGGLLMVQLRIASTFYAVKDYKSMLDYIVLVANNLPPNRGKVSKNLVVPAARHLHYLPLSRFAILQYCCRLLLEVIKTKFALPGDVGDWAVGNALVLMQIDWPQNAELLNTITERIVSTEAFRYPLFQTYIITIDILEELTYLWTEHGGGVSLEIALSSEVLQRSRITTRGADKGVREEVKQVMRRQAARDGVDPIDELVQRFIINEKAALLHSLMSK